MISLCGMDLLAFAISSHIAAKDLGSQYPGTFSIQPTCTDLFENFDATTKKCVSRCREIKLKKSLLSTFSSAIGWK